MNITQDMPVQWDETRALLPAAIGEVILMARRHRIEWWIAVMNRNMPRNSKSMWPP